MEEGIFIKLEYKATVEDDGINVKTILKNRLQLSERLLKKLKYNSRIRVNSIPVKVIDSIKAGDIVEALLDFDEDSPGIIPQDLPIDILYEDEALIVLNKPSDIVVHPTSFHPFGTMANALMNHFVNTGQKCTIRPVSRLDRLTTGVIIFAKNQHIQHSMINDHKTLINLKEYRGLVYGIPDSVEGVIELPIARLPGSIMQRHISLSGQKSITRYCVLETFQNASLMSFILETGRTHQIRVHMQAMGHPLIGDSLYPGSCNTYNNLIPHQALHSFKTRIFHPITQKEIEFTAPLPNDFLTAMEILRKYI